MVPNGNIGYYGMFCLITVKLAAHLTHSKESGLFKVFQVYCGYKCCDICNINVIIAFIVGQSTNLECASKYCKYVERSVKRLSFAGSFNQMFNSLKGILQSILWCHVACIILSHHFDSNYN